MRTYSKILFFFVGILYFFLINTSRMQKIPFQNVSDLSHTEIENKNFRLRTMLDGVYAYRQLHNGEYHILEIINPDEGVVLIREIRLTSEIDFVVTGVPKEWLYVKIIKLAWA